MNSFLIYMNLQGLSEKTIAEHSRGLVKFEKIGGDLKWSEEETVDFIKENYNVGSERKIISSPYPSIDTTKENQRRQYGIFFVKLMPKRLYYNVKRMIS